jgi:hypothetical protein
MLPGFYIAVKQQISTYLFLTGLFGLFITACDFGSSSSGTEADSLSVKTLDLETEGITGLLQSGGLQRAEAQKLGLSANSFQLISREQYFLETTEDLTQYWGQCVTVYGRQVDYPFAKANSDSADQAYAYERKLFKVDSVALQVYSFCAFSDSLQSRQPGQDQVQPYRGRVYRMRRPAPDIAYDYYLKTEEERIDSATGAPTNDISIYTSSYEVLSTLEAAIEDSSEVKLWAAEQAGYAEKLALQVIRAERMQAE